jgi:hypothetical protein
VGRHNIGLQRTSACGLAAEAASLGVRSLIAAAFMLVVSVSRFTAAATTPQTCFDFKIQMMEPQGAPVEIAIRGKTGTVLFSGSMSPKQKTLPIHLCWTSDNPPWQVEAKIDMGHGHFYGTVLSITNVSYTYCVWLPNVSYADCGPAGTGIDVGEGKH